MVAAPAPRLPTCLTRVGGQLRSVRQAGPRRLARELDRLGVAVGLDVAEGVRVRVEGDVELALLDSLIEPGAAEDEATKPVDEAAVGGPDQVGPVIVDVLAEHRDRLADLAVDGELEEVV